MLIWQKCAIYHSIKSSHLMRRLLKKSSMLSNVYFAVWNFHYNVQEPECNQSLLRFLKHFYQLAFGNDILRSWRIIIPFNNFPWYSNIKSCEKSDIFFQSFHWSMVQKYRISEWAKFQLWKFLHLPRANFKVKFPYLKRTAHSENVFL